MQVMNQKQSSDVIKEWPEESREAAQLAIDTYAEADEVTEQSA